MGFESTVVKNLLHVWCEKFKINQFILVPEEKTLFEIEVGKKIGEKRFSVGFELEPATLESLPYQEEKSCQG